VSGHRRRIWCETAPYAAIAAPEVLSALARRGIEIIVAAWPGPVDELAHLAARARDAGVGVAIWPMLADAAGRWASADNAGTFSAFVRKLVADLAARGVKPSEIAVDLEPPIDRMRKLLAGRLHELHAGSGEGLARARGAVAELLRALRGDGVRVSAAVVPLVLFDGAARPGGFERALGTPVSGIAWDHASVMVYSSLVEGYARGLLDRRDVRPLLAASCREAALRFGGAAGASLGAVGTGALGDEAVYRGVAELSDDVAIARGAGIDDLTLFDLGGVLRRPPFEAWLDAFTETLPAPAPPRPTAKSLALVGAGIGLGRALGAWGRLWG